MSETFAQSLNQTLQSLEKQAMTKRQIQALLVWFNQSETSANALDALLDESVTPAASIAPIIKETLDMDVADCYQSLVHLTPCDMAKFMLIQEFGPSFRQKSFFQPLVQLIASKI